MPVTVRDYKLAVAMFLERIEGKTGWGKEEIKRLWSESFQHAMTREDDEETQP